MKISMNELIQYLVEAFNEIFRPNGEDYPSIGVQPFDGDIYSQWV
ncbi:MAG: isochorismate synthase [Hormoscilla sp. GUM202]|nr:isochorismate synthase [Hormoscilla sp. GUM202]